jgi:DNA-binding beta-propeller fold protein YncE
MTPTLERTTVIRRRPSTRVGDNCAFDRSPPRRCGWLTDDARRRDQVIGVVDVTRRHRRRHRLLAAVVAAATSLTGCRTADDTATPAAEPSPGRDPTAMAALHWRQHVTTMCDHFTAGLAAIPQPDATATSVGAYVHALQALGDATPPLDAIALPAGQTARRDRLVALGAAANASLDTATAAAAAGDQAAATVAVRLFFDDLTRIRTGLASVGVRCGDVDPDRVATAQLNVPLEREAEQLAAGFGSIWVSERLGRQVVRVDPNSGTVTAAIRVGAEPESLQPADGRMWVRTTDHYVAIDPATNTVTAALATPVVGPGANSSWAVDGALWICDAHQIHRYNPTTVQLVATIDLDFDCGQVYANTDLVLAWNNELDDGGSAPATVSIVDPARDQLVATINLPVKVGVPAVLDDTVVFPGCRGSRAVAIDRATWRVIATPDLGRATAGSRPAFDGHSLYFATAHHHDLLVVDPSTYTVTDTIEPLDNAAIIDDGSLWTVGHDDVLQRRTLDG